MLCQSLTVDSLYCKTVFSLLLFKTHFIDIFCWKHVCSRKCPKWWEKQLCYVIWVTVYVGIVDYSPFQLPGHKGHQLLNLWRGSGPSVGVKLCFGLPFLFMRLEESRDMALYIWQGYLAHRYGRCSFSGCQAACGLLPLAGWTNSWVGGGRIVCVRYRLMVWGLGWISEPADSHPWTTEVKGEKGEFSRTSKL